VCGSEYFKSALKNTLIFTAVSIPAVLLLAYGIVCVLYKKSKRWGIILLLFLPALVPSASISALLENYAAQIGFAQIIVLFIIKNVGIICIAFRAGLLSIPNELFEAASIDGINDFTIHLYILFPLMKPYILFGALIGLIQSFKSFREIYLLFGDNPPDTLYMIPHWIFNKFNKMSYAELSAGTIVFSLCITGVSIFVACMLLRLRQRGK